MPTYRIQNGDELCHYGVLGMKWGRRKTIVPSSTMNQHRAKKQATKPTSGPKMSPTNLDSKKSVKSGKKKASSIVAKHGNESVKSIGKVAKTGFSIVQSFYNISDTATQNRQMTSYLNTATQMSPEYRRRFMYD